MTTKGFNYGAIWDIHNFTAQGRILILSLGTIDTAQSRSVVEPMKSQSHSLVEPMKSQSHSLVEPMKSQSHSVVEALKAQSQTSIELQGALQVYQTTAILHS
uniref:Uncharacterized protein n=1 Tax=Hucho hucho TaxID=62062 RepID=A0A4W5JXC9_9TELE